jgi:hypothetical protein
MPPKIMKMENIAAQDMSDSIQKDSYVDANQESTRYGNHPIILPLFERLRKTLTSLLSSLRYEAHTTPSKNEDLKPRGWEKNSSHNSPMVLFIVKTKRLECPYRLKRKL